MAISFPLPTCSEGAAVWFLLLNPEKSFPNFDDILAENVDGEN